MSAQEHHHEGLTDFIRHLGLLPRKPRHHLFTQLDFKTLCSHRPSFAKHGHPHASSVRSQRHASTTTPPSPLLRCYLPHPPAFPHINNQARGFWSTILAENW